ncbi:MAG: hypothetical protein QOG64_78 [Acidimicrobiaceae bacterium]|jgi:hypothetical protein|nr:hypothetical protein [Acidimicrobiaceae bacterium]
MSDPQNADRRDAVRHDTALVERVVKPGTAVEVRQRLDHAWARGFEVAEVLSEGYRIKRLSDGRVLPAEFCFADVRKERRKQGLWWY